MNILQILGLSLLTLALAGCAVTRVDQDQVTNVRHTAQEVFGDSTQYILMPIGSKGEQADAMVLQTKAITGHPSVPAEQLAKWLNPAHTRPLRIAITGVSSKFAAAITAEALSLSAERDLPGLRLLFVGDEADKLTVQQAVEAHGGTFYFRFK